MIESIPISFRDYKIYRPEIILKMQREELVGIAEQASSLIEQLGGEHMFHPTKEELLAYLQAGMACYAVDYTGKLGGFIKVDPWLYYPAGEPKTQQSIVDKLKSIDSGTAFLAVLETGSLVVDQKDQNNGLGTELKVQMSIQASTHFPGIPVIAVITNDNAPSIHNNKKLGWVHLDNGILRSFIGIDVLRDWDPPSTIFVYPKSIKAYH
jgi:hypothetical protein